MLCMQIMLGRVDIAGIIAVWVKTGSMQAELLGAYVSRSVRSGRLFLM